MQRNVPSLVPYVPDHKPCGLILKMNIDPKNMNNLSKAMKEFPLAYVFTPEGIYFVDIFASSCTAFALEPQAYQSLVTDLGLDRQFKALIESNRKSPSKDCRRNKNAMSLVQLNRVSAVTNHTLPPLNLNEILKDLCRNYCTYEGWEKYISSKANVSDEMLYQFVLGVDVNGIISAAQPTLAKHEIEAQILAAAKAKIDEMKSTGIKIPEGTYNDRAYIFCLLEAYRRVREQGKEFESTKSSLLSSVYPGLSMIEKLSYCQLYKKFVTSEYDFNEFDEFLKNTYPPKGEKVKVGLFRCSSNMLKLKSTILQGFILAVHNCAQGLAIKKLPEEKDKPVSNGLFGFG